MKKVLKTLIVALVVLPIMLFSAACDIFPGNNPVEKIDWIQVDSIDHQTQFAYNQELNVERLTITISYKNARQDAKIPVAKEWVTGYSRVTAGEQTLTITYKHPQGPDSNVKTTTYTIKMLSKKADTYSVLLPSQYKLGPKTMYYDGLVTALSERAVDTGMQVSGDPSVLAKVDVAANITSVMMNLFFSNSLGTSHASMGAQGYSHGGTVANAANGINTMSARSPATRYIHTNQIASLTPAQAEALMENGFDTDDHVNRYRPHMWFTNAEGERYYNVANSAGGATYYAHHYYDEADFEGFTTKAGVTLMFDSNQNEEVWVYHSVYGLVRNRDVICDRKRCDVWTNSTGICSNPDHRVRYVPGFRDVLAKAIYEELDTVNEPNFVPLTMYQTLSPKLAKLTVDFFKDYFTARYTAEEKSSNQGYNNAVSTLTSIFRARFSATGSYSIGNVKNLIDESVKYHTSGVRREMNEIVKQALIDVVEMKLTVFRESSTAREGVIMLEVGDRQIFGEGPLAEQPYEILDTGVFSFVNFGPATSHIKMTFEPQGKNFYIRFAFGTGTSTPRSLADILFTQYGAAHVSVNEFVPITQVLASEGFAVLMMPK